MTFDARPPLTAFRDRQLPIPARLAGYSELMSRYDLRVPLHREMAAVSPKNARRKQDGWLILPAAQMPGSRLIDHLVFALKYEGVQLLTLKKIFERMEPSVLEAALRDRPTSTYVRRLCFFYEWFGNRDRLDVADVTAGIYIEAIDPDQQHATRLHSNSRRFRVRDNLPGTRLFCPLVFRSQPIDAFLNQDLSGRAKSIVRGAPKELIARAAAFLMLSDSKASFAIEGENPPKDRIARWGNVVARSGREKLTASRLVDLQRELVGDDRFVRLGLRQEGGFIGRHDALGHPEPEHISADGKNLDDLIAGLVEFDSKSKQYDYDSVLAAACIAFGFVYIHPFEDGNGRIHRFLMHHVLAEREFTPREIVFPISSVIYDDVARYKDVLESVSRPLLSLISWRPTEKGNVEVLQDTADFYRFFDATAHAEYLFRCILRAVEKDLPAELSFLKQRDEFHRRVTAMTDMSERTLDLLLAFLRQGGGRLSKRALEGEFRLLQPSEIDDVEAAYRDLFG